VHLNLAKYAGPAACYPATRQVVDQLFLASDDDNSGGIDENEFVNIMVRYKC
jgi:Ca2+-binding EF-hand superfamily protein